MFKVLEDCYLIPTFYKYIHMYVHAYMHINIYFMDPQLHTIVTMTIVCRISHKNTNNFDKYNRIYRQIYINAFIIYESYVIHWTKP
jgi:hypothetical protein